MRLNQNLNKYLSSVTDDINAQIDWIYEYKKREENNEEYYFIIENKQGNKYGTLRIYNINQKECTWGSFILIPERPSYFSYKSARLSFHFIFNELNLKIINLDVDKENSKAIHVYKKLGFEETHRDKKNIYMKLTEEEYKKSVEV